jgi:hypothetical protein
MKTIIKIFLVFIPFMNLFASTQDTIYVMRSGMIVFKKALTDVDSISFENTVFNRKSIVNRIAEDPSYSIFYQGLVATGLEDSLLVDRDKNYNSGQYKSLLMDFGITQGSGSVDELPAVKRYGFTVLMESDSIFKSYSITNLSDLKAYAATIYNSVYPEDAGINDVTNRKNSLNRFIAYHIINKKLSIPMFIDAYDVSNMIKTVDMYEYLEPMCPNTLIEIKKERSSGLTNLINQSADTGNAIHIIKKNDDRDVYNGFYYGIDKIMSYNTDLIRNLSGKRLRFDMAALFPELTNNVMRASGKVQSWLLPNGYLKGVICSQATCVTYLNAFGGYLDNQGDEMYFKGPYDFTFITPPVPAGTYEVRFGYCPTGGGGIAEFYMDSVSFGAPIDLRLEATSPGIGYVKPGTDPTDPYGYENDKMMRNHGYMKGPGSFKDALGWWYGKLDARNSDRNLRKILGTYTFSTNGNHRISVKGLIDALFTIDFIEFVPVSTLESEDIY